MEQRRNIAVVAHDNCKQELLEWVECSYTILLHHNLIATGTTGKLVDRLLQKKASELEQKDVKPVSRLKSGPLGGDQQLGALIAEGQVDILIFFWDPMQPQPHDVDVKALLRLAVVYNIPTASNRSSADFLISSPLLETEYQIKRTDFSDYLNRL